MSTRTAKATGMIALFSAALVLTGAAAMQDAQSDEQNRVGIVQVQEVFDAYPGLDDFNRQVQPLQQEFAQAQQAGDQERLQELQARYAQMQQELNAKFESHLKEASREIAKEREVKLIVSEVIYQENGFEEVELTGDLVDVINDIAD